MSRESHARRAHELGSTPLVRRASVCAGAVASRRDDVQLHSRSRSRSPLIDSTRSDLGAASCVSRVYRTREQTTSPSPSPSPSGAASPTFCARTGMEKEKDEEKDGTEPELEI